MKTKSQAYILLTTIFFFMFNSVVALSPGKKTDIVLSSKETAEALTSLAEYEVDISHLIQTAVENIKDKKLKVWLMNVKEEKDAHVKLLNKLIVDFGAPLIAKHLDKNGTIQFYHSGHADISTLKRDDAILKTLAKEENKNLEKFEATLNLKLPKKAQTKVRNLYSHNKQYLSYLEHLVNVYEK